MSSKLPIDERLRADILPFHVKADLPVNRWAIRRWCGAIGLDCKLYLDPQRAEAPLPLLHMWTVWETTRSPLSINKRLRDELTTVGYPAIVATNYDIEQYRPAQIGETLSTRIRLGDISTEKQTPLGPGYFATELHEFFNDSDELLGRVSIRCLYFRPGPPAHAKPKPSPTAAQTEPTAPKIELARLDISISATTIIAGALAFNDFELVHHDKALAQSQGLPDIIINSATSLGLVYRYLIETAPVGWQVKRVATKLGSPCIPGDTLSFSGRNIEGDETSFDIRAVTARGEHLRATASSVIPD